MTERQKEKSAQEETVAPSLLTTLSKWLLTALSIKLTIAPSKRLLGCGVFNKALLFYSFAFSSFFCILSPFRLLIPRTGSNPDSNPGSNPGSNPDSNPILCPRLVYTARS